MKAKLRKIYSMLLVLCVVVSTVALPVSAEIITGATEADPNLIYFRDFEGETHLGDGNTRLAANTSSTDWVWSYSGSTFKTQTIDGSTVMVENSGGGDSNVYRLPSAVESGRFYLSMDIGFTDLNSYWDNGLITFYTEEYPADNGGGYTAFDEYGRRHIVKIYGRNAGYNADHPDAYMNAYVGSPGDGFNSFNTSSGAQEYLEADKLHRLDMVYNIDAGWCVVLLDGKQMLNQAVSADYAVNKITAIGLRTRKGMFFDNIRIATKPDNSFDAIIENKTSTGFDIKFNQSVHELTVDNVLVNEKAVTNVTKKNCDTYTVECTDDPANAYIELIDVKNFMNESPNTTTFGEKNPATAEIILETTNAAPADGAVVPMGETLMVSTNITPTGYTWYYEGSTTVRATTATFYPPASYRDGGGEKKVYCEIAYDGGTITTQSVILEPVVISDPHSYVNKDGDNAYKVVPNAENSNPDYTFYVDGKGFVLAKEQNVKGSAYFIVAMDAYGDIYNNDNDTANTTNLWKNYDGHNGFVADDSGSTMQTKLLGEGNTYEALVTGNTETYALPGIFNDYIDMDHSWPLSSRKGGSVNAITSGVVIPSYSDYVNYADRIGWKDNLYSKVTDGDVLLRDLVSVGKSYENAAGQVVTAGGLDSSYSAHPQYLVRPCFWLTKDFFEKNVIDLSSAGSGVIAVMKDATYTNRETLKTTYTSAGKENDYNYYLGTGVSTEIVVEDGGELTGVEFLEDNLKLECAGITPTSFKWQTEENGVWTDIAGETADTLPVTYALEGKNVRCVVSLGGESEYPSDAVAIPEKAALPYTTKDGLNNPEWEYALNEDSSPADSFTVDGKSFVLADTHANEDSRYFVVAKDGYGDLKLGAEDAAKASYYSPAQTMETLNNYFLKNGNNYSWMSTDTTTVHKLPDSIVAQINTNHVWPVWTGGAAESISDTAVGGVSMLSQADLVNYKDKLGYADNVFAGVTKATTYGWAAGPTYLLRTVPDATGENIGLTQFGLGADLTTGTGYKGTVANLPNANSAANKISQLEKIVRPCFYLKKDAFKSIKIDLATAGANVKAMLLEELGVAGVKEMYGEIAYKAYMSDEVSFSTTVRATGEAADTAKLMDTLVFEMTGMDGEFTYTWQVQENGEWVAAPEANVNGNELALTNNLAGKNVRGVAIQGENSIYAPVVAVPDIEAYTQAPGTADAEITLAKADSAETHKFTVDGKEFVLLEKFDNDVATYYVTTTDSYGTTNYVSANGKEASKTYTAYGQFDGSPLEGNLMDEAKGNNYLGITGNTGEEYIALPDEISENIYKEHIWVRYVHSNWASSRGVGNTYASAWQMLSMTDFVKYEDILGYKDNVFAKGGSYYVLRDTCSTLDAWSNNSVVSIDGKATEITTGTTDMVPLVRPAFYLGGDFFKNVALDDIADTGSAVLDIMKEKYYVEDLQHLYSATTLESLGFRNRLNITPEWTDKDGKTITDISTATSLKVSLDINNLTKDAQTGVLILAVYNKDGMVVAMNMTTDVSIPANGTVNTSCTIESMTGAEGMTAQAMLWNGLNTMMPLAAAVEM